jgi:hypothetical protein
MLLHCQTKLDDFVHSHVCLSCPDATFKQKPGTQDEQMTSVRSLQTKRRIFTGIANEEGPKMTNGGGTVFF